MMLFDKHVVRHVGVRHKVVCQTCGTGVSQRCRGGA